jgi:GT2 family glycosyltransferase
MPSVSIVIPTYNHYDLLHNCLFDIYRTCRNRDEVLVMNDCSTDEEVAGGLSWWKSSGMLPIRHIRSDVNQGFLLSSNYALKKATGEVKILLSNDVKLLGDITQPIIDALAANPKTLVGGILYEHNTGWNTFGDKTFPYLEGWLLATSAENWEELGYLDEPFAPCDFEDVDLSTKALSLGYQLKAIGQGITQHLGAQSIGYSPTREAHTKQNQEIFKQKWLTVSVS